MKTYHLLSQQLGSPRVPQVRDPGARRGGGRPVDSAVRWISTGDNPPMTDPAVPPPPEQPRNPLHGLTLEAIVTALVAEYGWDGLDQRIPLRCFAFDPSVKSSLKFLRRTPWAREKVEGLYLFMLRELRRDAQARPRA